jgi:hypothetical protein
MGGFCCEVPAAIKLETSVLVICPLWEPNFVVLTNHNGIFSELISGEKAVGLGCKAPCCIFRIVLVNLDVDPVFPFRLNRTMACVTNCSFHTRG